MCVIAAVPAGKQVSLQHFGCAADNNEDGFGLAYVDYDNSSIEMFKTMDRDEFEQEYFHLSKKNPESPFLLHFRIATHGTIDTFNVHPFKITDGLVMAHNGILSFAKPDKEDDRSDTQVFVDDYLKELPENFVENPIIMEFIRDYIGGGNKLAFLSREGEVYVVNSSAGTVEDDIWWSNSSFKWSRTSRTSGASTPSTPPPSPAPEVPGLSPFRDGSTYTSWVSAADESAAWEWASMPGTPGSRCFVLHPLSGEFHSPSCRLCQHYGACVCSSPPAGQGTITLPEGLEPFLANRFVEAVLPVAHTFRWEPHYHRRAKQELKCRLCRVARASGNPIRSIMDEAKSISQNLISADKE